MDLRVLFYETELFVVVKITDNSRVVVILLTDKISLIQEISRDRCKLRRLNGLLLFLNHLSLVVRLAESRIFYRRLTTLTTLVLAACKNILASRRTSSGRSLGRSNNRLNNRRLRSESN